MSFNLLSRAIPVVNKCLFSPRAPANIIVPCHRYFSLFKPFQNNNAVEASASSSSKSNEVTVKEASKDRTKVIPLETSIRYLQSSAYNWTYGDQPVWKPYRRNHKGAIPPRKTRRTCIRQGQVTTGNPCPICRDEYLVLHPENVGLLKQFISPHTGEVLNYSVTGVCQKKHKEILVAIEVAKDRGLITYDVPFRSYDYSLYRPQS